MLPITPSLTVSPSTILSPRSRSSSLKCGPITNATHSLLIRSDNPSLCTSSCKSVPTTSTTTRLVCTTVFKPSPHPLSRPSKNSSASLARPSFPTATTPRSSTPGSRRVPLPGMRSVRDSRRRPPPRPRLTSESLPIMSRTSSTTPRLTYMPSTSRTRPSWRRLLMLRSPNSRLS